MIPFTSDETSLTLSRDPEYSIFRTLPNFSPSFVHILFSLVDFSTDFSTSNRVFTKYFTVSLLKLYS